MSDGVRADAYWAMIPEWVLYADISAQAVRVYATLQRHANEAGTCFPGRKGLAEKMKCSVATLDRAIGELELIGAVSVQPRYRVDEETGEVRGQSSNEYFVATIDPSSVVSRGGAHLGGGGVLTGDEHNQSHLTRATEPEPPIAPQGGAVALKEWQAEFADFYALYPRKVKRATAFKAWIAAMKAGTSGDEIIAKLRHQLAIHPKLGASETRYILHPASWLNAEGWNDEIEAPVEGRSTRTQRNAAAREQVMAAIRGGS